MTYLFLQHYWCFVVALLAALLVFLMFVQGANSLIFSLGKTEDERRLILNSTGRKWEFTFTTLVTFGGAFFASYPLFYSTSFGGAYWLWMLILFSFVLQAVAYEFQRSAAPGSKGKAVWRYALVLNGIVGPLLLGGAVATFFTGSNFIVERDNVVDGLATPIISRWANGSHGLDALLNPWNVLFGLAVVELARTLGILYLMNNVADDALRTRGSVRLAGTSLVFVVLFLAFLGRVLLGDGFAVEPETGVVFMEPMKYLRNLIDMWPLLVMLVVGVVFVLYGILRTIISKTYTHGIWPAGFGTVVTVLVLLLLTAWNNTAYYPSTADLQSSLTMQNSSCSEFTLRTMFWVSLLVPFVLAYIVYAWHAIDRRELTREELEGDHAY